MESELDKKLKKLESWSSWLKEITRLILFDYLYIYSVHGVCQRNVQRSSLSAAYLVNGRLWLFALFRFDVSSSYPSYP